MQGFYLRLFNNRVSRNLDCKSSNLDYESMNMDMLAWILIINAGLGSMDPRTRNTGQAGVPGVLAFSIHEP